MKNILVTGGLGFIGSNFLNIYVDQNPDFNFVNLDKLTYAADKNNISEKTNQANNYNLVIGDISDSELVEKIFKEHHIDTVINFAAESHVDLSISNPSVFLESNVRGTLNLLEVSRKFKVQRYLQVSTDEVYGSLGSQGEFTEDTQIQPNSPYSASKAAADGFVRSYYKTFGVPILITRCSNNYGPNQDKTKLIPKFISLLLTDQKVPLYKDGANIRDWLFVEDHCSAIWEVLNRGRVGEVYNVGGGAEKTNLEITKLLLDHLGKDESYINFVEDRPGHDFRYAIDYSKLNTELGWSPKYTFEKGIAKTIEFYKSKL
jgi:dTDP-glucose 4,6-dehydratase